MKDPRTSKVLNELMDDKGEIWEGNCPEKLVKLARNLEYELAQERENVKTLRDALSALIYTAERNVDLIISVSDRYDLDVAIESAKEALK